VAAMQVGISKSFSLLVASMENDQLSTVQNIHPQSQVVTTMLEATLMNAATYVLQCGVIGLGVPRHRSLVVESARQRASIMFDHVMNKLYSTTSTLDKLALDSNDAYQASSVPSLTVTAIARRDSLLNLYGAIDALSNSLPKEQFADQRVVGAIIEHLHTDTFLSTLGSLDNPPVLESDDYPQIIEWSKSTYAFMSGLKDAYTEYKKLHESFFAVEDDEMQEVGPFPDVIDYWYDLTDKMDAEPSPPSVLRDPNDFLYRIYQPDKLEEPQDGPISDTGATSVKKLHLRLKI